MSISNNKCVYCEKTREEGCKCKYRTGQKGESSIQISNHFDNCNMGLLRKTVAEYFAATNDDEPLMFNLSITFRNDRTILKQGDINEFKEAEFWEKK